MITTRRQLNILRRLTAALFALCYLWMATGGVVHHTDDMRAYTSASSQVVLTQPGVTLPAADLCAACEWTSSLATLHTLMPPLTQPLAPRDPLTPPTARPVLPRPVLSLSDRAPPVLS